MNLHEKFATVWLNTLNERIGSCVAVNEHALVGIVTDVAYQQLSRGVRILCADRSRHNATISMAWPTLHDDGYFLLMQSRNHGLPVVAIGEFWRVDSEEYNVVHVDGHELTTRRNSPLELEVQTSELISVFPHSPIFTNNGECVGFIGNTQPYEHIHFYYVLPVELFF